ncbi:unnamed protein product [Closterium sp. Yama58-4]|nr:unnamed protein product [Closterium sp. Yama58-4]
MRGPRAFCARFGCVRRTRDSRVLRDGVRGARRPPRRADPLPRRPAAATLAGRPVAPRPSVAPRPFVAHGPVARFPSPPSLRAAAPARSAVARVRSYAQLRVWRLQCAQLHTQLYTNL